MDLSDLLFSPQGATVQLVHLSRKLVSQTCLANKGKTVENLP